MMRVFNCPGCAATVETQGPLPEACPTCGYVGSLDHGGPAWEPVAPARRRVGKRLLLAAVLVAAAVALAPLVAPGVPWDIGTGTQDTPAEVPPEKDTGSGSPEKEPEAGSPEPDGGSADAEAGDAAPEAAFTFSCMDFSCTFDGSPSDDPGGLIESWAWDFGDGATAEGARTSHTYADDEPGRVVTLSVTDDDGNAATHVEPLGAVAAPPDPITYTDSGDGTTTTFTTEHRLLRITLEHGGLGDFEVWLQDAAGDDEMLLIETDDRYEGSRYVAVAPGDHRLQVVADGTWRITIEQPRSAGEEPTARRGSGDAALQGVRLGGGSVTFSMTHEGEGRFVVRLYDAAGDVVAVVADADGDFEGEEAVDVEAGVHHVEVRAGDGSWMLRFG